MNEMIERIAKAIGDAARQRHGGTMMAWAFSPERKDCLVFAEAAVTAMLIPTAAMIDAANDAVFEEGEPPSLVEVVWRSMIAEAFKSTANQEAELPAPGTIRVIIKPC